MATPSSILAWRISWTQEPGWFQSIGSQRVRHDQSDPTHTHTHTHKFSPPNLCQALSWSLTYLIA